MGAGGEYPYPKWVWTYYGGWWPKGGLVGAIGTVVVMGGIGAAVFNLSCQLERRGTYPLVWIPSMLWAKEFQDEHLVSEWKKRLEIEEIPDSVSPTPIPSIPNDPIPLIPTTPNDPIPPVPTTPIPTTLDSPKYPKKRVAILFGYRGTGYLGLQANPGMITIESVLHDAFASTGIVSKDNAHNPQKIGFSRCARTDKGVHAAGQVVSLKALMIPNIKKILNEALPDHITVFDILKVSNTFNCKNHCGGRCYEYSFPTYILQHPEVSYPFSDYPLSTSFSKSYRISSETSQELSGILKEYQGSHNYHNYTVNCPYKDKAASRYIKSFTVEKIFIQNDIEWCTLNVQGQSFMLHQIRKMVGLAVLMLRTKTPSLLIQKTFGATKLNIPKAPATGLLLRKPLFDAYNKQYQKLVPDSVGIEFDSYKDQMDNFCLDYIYPEMFSEEQKGTFVAWTDGIDERAADYAWYLTKNGDIFSDDRPGNMKEGILLDKTLNQVENLVNRTAN